MRYVPKAFALVMILIGAVDLYRPAPIKEAMESLNMPLYLLWILGGAKLLGGLILLVDRYDRLTEWAFAGFFIWAIGSISAHLFSGHGITKTAPILVLTTFLTISFYCHEQTRSKFHSTNAENLQ